MHDILLALGCSIRSLLRPAVFRHLIWPGVAAALLWTVVAVLSWEAIIDAAMRWTEGVGAWIGSAQSIVAGVLLLLVKITVAFVFLLLIHVTAMLLVVVVALPMMLDQVAASDYADLEQRQGGSLIGSIRNTLVASMLFALVLIVSLPLWLLPGMALMALLLATGWLNQRIMGYDVLMRHADRDELAHLRRALRLPLLLLSCGAALLACVPVLNIVTPAFEGLVFVHFMLRALRRERGVSILDPEPEATDISTAIPISGNHT
ncbi:MAG: EI24 domain-containing protein [Azoarcus sp.]|jgi:hypothetical protein|nr:EI24 domain-containing protein [Azoarcus sp.]